jgi:1-acyl-sn-glycerol-3-phosphate acyltransferase
MTMPPASTTVRAPATDPVPGEALLSVVAELAAELHAGRRGAITLDTRLEDEIGLDSLARMELLLRIQRRFGVSVAEEQALTAQTPRQLLRALELQEPRATLTATPAEPARRAIPRTAAPPADIGTLVDALGWLAKQDPDRIHIELYESGDVTSQISYGQLLDEAGRLASGLLARDVARGQRVALMLPTGRDFFVAFVGIWLAGAVPVPIYPPFRSSQLEEHLRRQALILENAGAVLLIGSADTARAARWLRGRLIDLRAVATVAELRGNGPPPSIAFRPSDMALLQYTSGSTGDPKGVVLTHANLLANVRAIGEAAQIRSDDVVVSWLPLYHDMGLIGAWLGSLYHGCRLVVMPPTRFLAQPAAWLRAIHRHRGTLAAAPNFAYEICASKLADEDLTGLELDSWRLALNGSEPVSPATIEGFARRFAPHGFRALAMTPVYGLAECSVALAFTEAGRGPRLDRVERTPFESEGRAEPAGASSSTPLVFVSCGRPIARHEVRIVDDLGREQPDRRLGRVQFRGPSSTAGYFRNPEATRALIAGDWLNTGDLGYVADGELYVTGRSKDVIIRAGRHLFPYEIEEAVGTLPGIRRGGVAVFSASDQTRGTEKLVIVAETRAADVERPEDLRSAIDARAAAFLGTAAEEVLLVPPRTVPKTSSGKTRRAACRDLYLRGMFGRTRSRRRQLLALAWRLWLPLVRRTGRAAAALAYAGWFWLWLGVLAVPAWALAVALPGERARWRAVSAIVRTFFFVAGVRIRLQGREHLAGPPRVVVFNHASYLDSVALVGLLPPGFSLVAKRELESNPLLRRALRRLGVLFVERFDPRRAAHEVDALAECLRRGRSLVVFPEGTNRRIPGLFPFHAGAFVVAARASVPLVPGGIVGSRVVLRADQWFPRHGSITVKLRAPLTADGTSWEAALGLCTRARALVAETADEPIVD